MEPKTQDLQNAPVIGLAEIEILERLSNASGVSGDEVEIRKLVLELVKPLVDDVQVDALGNVIAVHKAKQDGAMKVMLDAHLDEVGFMITYDDGDGMFQFAPVGGIDLRVLPGKPVLIGRDKIPAVIGARAIHLTTVEERKKQIPLDTLRMDVGPGDAAKKVSIGDRAVFDTRFCQLGPSLRGKALDDRIGVATLIELLKKAPPEIELQVVFSTQEEIGGRGARVAAYALNPDLAFVVDSTPAYDLPAWDDEENTRYNTRLGLGPAIYTLDSGTISDPRLVAFLVQTAEDYAIPYQLRQGGAGGTNAGAIHLQGEGIPSVSISVPGRYAHTPMGLVRLEDWQNTVSLLYAALRRLTPSVLAR